MAKHGSVKDSGEYFVIDPISRKVTVPHAHKYIGTVGDHNSEQITFVCPRIIDGHDISQCTDRYVTWMNVKGDLGNDRLQAVIVEQSAEGMVYFSWTIGNGLTVATGIVQFSVHFEDIDEGGTTLYRWSTASCKDCNILDSVNALLGGYKAISVAEDTLIISDYSIIKDKTLALNSDSIIPKGTVSITQNGLHDVSQYAQAEVMVNPVTPQISVSQDGVVKATANGFESTVQLSAEHDADLIPENIKSGVNIFGVQGSHYCPKGQNKPFSIKLNDLGSGTLGIAWASFNSNSTTLNYNKKTIDKNVEDWIKELAPAVAVGSVIVVYCNSGNHNTSLENDHGAFTLSNGTNYAVYGVRDNEADIVVCVGQTGGLG